MKRIFIGLLLQMAISGNGWAASCPTSLELQWRSGVTHLLPNKEAAATSSLRETKMQGVKQALEDFIFKHVDVPEMEFIAAEGVVVKLIKTWQKNELPFIEVGNLPGGVLHGTILLPVSGHLGNENARKWAKTDTYTLYLKDEAGATTAIVQSAASLEAVTFQELQIQLVKGQVYRLEYHRSGSGGPSGFPGGRILDIRWDGT